MLVLQTLLEALPEDVRNYGIQLNEGAGDQAALQNELRIHAQLTEAIVRRDLEGALAAFKEHQDQEAALIQRYYNGQ